MKWYLHRLNTFRYHILVKHLTKQQILKEMQISPATYYRYLVKTFENVEEISLSTPPYSTAANTLTQLQNAYRNAINQYNKSTNDKEKIKLLKLQNKLCHEITRTKLSTIGMLQDYDKYYKQMSKEGLTEPFKM